MSAGATEEEAGLATTEVGTAGAENGRGSRACAGTNLERAAKAGVTCSGRSDHIQARIAFAEHDLNSGLARARSYAGRTLVNASEFRGKWGS